VEALAKTLKGLGVTVDLAAHYCAYAHTVVQLPERREVELRAATENALKIFVNGQTIFSREEYHHGHSFDQHVVRVELRKGRNTILVKVCQDEEKGTWAQTWDFQLRVCDAVGSPVPLKIVGQEKEP
jgi:hypothetical protein